MVFATRMAAMDASETTPYFMTTERLGFRVWTREDLPLAVALWGDPEVMRYIGGPFCWAAAETRLMLEMERHARVGVQYWPIFELATGRHAGCAGLRPFRGQEGVFEVGAHIARPFWSGRFGEEAARAVIGYGFERKSARALTAGHHPENQASRSLLLRLGFEPTHREPWGASGLPHEFYRLEAVDLRA